jgi:hypothetical protein
MRVDMMEVELNLAVQSEVAGTIESSTVTWKQSNKHYITPTLVLACGKIPSDDVEAIRLNIEQRIGAGLDPDEWEDLGFTVPADVIRWERIETSAQATKDTIERFVAPFSQLEYVQRLVDRGILPEMPTKDKPLHIQVIVLHEDGADSDFANLLQTLADGVSKVFEHNATFALVLIAIGELDPTVQNGALYWPRFRLQTRTAGGMVATRERILEVCQNLIVALVSSELVSKIDTLIGQEKQSIKWIWIGGSALISDVANMYEYVRLNVLQELVNLLLKEKLTPDDQRWIDDWMQDQISLLQDTTRKTALSIAENQKWDIRPKVKPPDLAAILRRKIYGFFLSRFRWDIQLLKEKEEKLPLPLMPGIELKDKIASPDKSLTIFLLECYRRLRDGLEEEGSVGATVQREYRELLKNLSTLIRSPEASTTTSTALSSTQTTLSTGTSQSPIQTLGPRRPGGLAAVIYATARACSVLRQSRDVPIRDITIHRTKSDYYLTAVAEADADGAYAAYRRWFRYKRSLLSPWGYLLSLIPL